MISVIIPVYNAEPYLRCCLDSVLDSTYQDFELLLVNDGSTDKSLEICQEYAARDSRVQLLSQQNCGASAARNRGLELCHGEWVVFSDADDLISPDFLALIAQEEYQSQDLLLFDFAETREDLTAAPVLEAQYFGAEEIPDLLRSLLLRTQLINGGNLNFVSPCGKAYRKAIIDRHTLRFSSRLFFAEDKLFNTEYLTKTNRCIYLPTPVYYYNIHPDSLSHRFNPKLPYNLAELLERLRDALTSGKLFAPLERDFYSYALENLSYSMVWTVFSPENRQTYREKLAVCRALRENQLYCKAMEYNYSCGHWVRRIFVLLFRLRWYFLAGLLARLWYHYLLWKNRL
ncbi:glycosyltransferase [Pseudoflavonifractor sp. 524-17]|uniref:glycosyltransferase family 2 protein n=1 Tax=Pseudoflavonifractor sp. 524-17 TaxID=2304577 RepID=UPI00137A4CE1|nr:glycosyltransferase [Pseudoflavonifractor sp. 524-17]NCE66176.1 glycosyltransferase [Pseudoflavonifractor sp. 524-17]